MLSDKGQEHRIRVYKLQEAILNAIHENDEGMEKLEIVVALQQLTDMFLKEMIAETYPFYEK